MKRPQFVVLLPVKAPALGKSRLRVPEHLRPGLASAFALDTLHCRRGHAGGDRRSLVVTDDPGFATTCAALGVALPDARRWPQRPQLVVRRLPPRSRARWPAAVPVALCADLPCLRPDDLTEALAQVTDGALRSSRTRRARARRCTPRRTTSSTRAFGTALALPPTGRRARRDVLGELPTLRRDVDDEATLAAAMRLGPGPITREALALFGPRHADRGRPIGRPLPWVVQDFLAVFFAVFLAGAFLAAFLAGAFFAVVFLAVDFLAAVFFVVLFLAGAFFAAVFFVVVFFAGAFFAVVFLAGAFFAVVFLAVVFFAADFLAGAFFAGPSWRSSSSPSTSRRPRPSWPAPSPPWRPSRQHLRPPSAASWRRRRRSSGLAGSELRHRRLLGLDALAGLRVADPAGLADALLERAEAGDRDLLALGDLAGDRVEHGLECVGGLLAVPLERAASASISCDLFTVFPSDERLGPSFYSTSPRHARHSWRRSQSPRRYGC